MKWLYEINKMHINTVANFVGQYYVELGGCDAMVFTAGLGENDIDFRVELCEKIGAALGVELDLEANNVRGQEVLVSKPTSKVKVFVIPTNEEIVIARDTMNLLGL